MFGALGQNQHFVALRGGAGDFVSDGDRATGIAGKIPEHVLDAGARGKGHASRQVAGYHLQSLQCTS